MTGTTASFYVSRTSLPDMYKKNIPFQTIDCKDISGTEHRDETGVA